jgi:hypothetical protein
MPNPNLLLLHPQSPPLSPPPPLLNSAQLDLNFLFASGPSHPLSALVPVIPLPLMVVTSVACAGSSRKLPASSYSSSTTTPASWFGPVPA